MRVYSESIKCVREPGSLLLEGFCCHLEVKDWGARFLFSFWKNLSSIDVGIVENVYVKWQRS